MRATSDGHNISPHCETIIKLNIFGAQSVPTIRAARSIQCYQVHENNEFTGENLQVQHTFLTMAWRVVCELLLLSKFVSLSVIPANRKLNELSSVPEEAESQRTKRSLGYSFYSDDDDDVEVVEHWESL